MSEYNKLTEEERQELVLRIAGGQICRSCSRTHVDHFSIALTQTSGRIVQGSYKWGSGLGEFISLEITEGVKA